MSFFQFGGSKTSPSARKSSQPSIGSLKVSQIGVGTWSWGNKFLWGYNQAMDDELQATFNFCIDSGVNWFDTADSYGTGKLEGQSEKLLGKFISEYPREAKRDGIYVASKFAPYPWRIGSASMEKACMESMGRLGRSRVDIGQLHWPPSLGWQEEAYLEAFAQLYKSGKISEIGLSNYGPKKLVQVQRSLAQRGVAAASNQVQFSLISRLPLESGLTEVAKESGVQTIGYSPLGLGLLTGRYSIEDQKLPLGPRKFLAKELLPEIKPITSTLNAIAGSRRVSMSQVAINWTKSKGALPIVGLKSVAQAKDNLGALKW
eukprot:CAMPEP_0194719000 /NCGR_PEP_ID=MMETSP0296-20130528/10500_1 /TAXON_ID=39354 /ORGANISM="Heterosigma akashiwo, Strain CCMP2393" /LENGTH=316 /DNA_ID=CAMNT_0039620545 /DNA_START=5 /DNA_END=952 /DNA_ORIENTATION=-